jgi:hypothetical protein
MKIDKRQHLTTRLAYIAGFVDGEGCIRIKKSNQSGNSYYVTFQVTNTDKAPLELIQSIFGGKVFYQEKGVNRIIWQYYITCAEAVDALRTISGFLITKKKQAEIAIWFHDNKSTLNSEQKLAAHNKISRMKKDIYETPELIN